MAAFLNAGVRRLNLEPSRLELSTWDVIEKPSQYPALDDVDALVITGSSECS